MRKKMIATVVISVVLFSLGSGIAIGIKKVTRPGAPGQPASGGVGALAISGALSCGRTGGGLWGFQTGSEDITARLRAAAKDPAIKAVVLRLNSPGGTASAAQEIAVEVDRLRQAGKKVVASMGDVSASGAYWIASRADRIVANPGTLTGSIGVIMETQDLRGLYEKIGVRGETFKSGPHKDMGSPSRAVSSEEKFIFQSMVDDIYEQFVATVAEGRKMDVSVVRSLADGRIFTGRQAKEAGLVDELGNYHQAISVAGTLVGLGDEPPVIELGPRGFWRDFFGGRLGIWHQFLPPFTLDENLEMGNGGQGELSPAFWLIWTGALNGKGGP